MTSEIERVSSFAATLIGNACERHSAEIAVMGFHEFQQVQPKSCHWCCEADRDRLAAEVERLREALERIVDMAMTATVKGAPPLSGYRVRQIVGAALAALAEVPAPAREESPDSFGNMLTGLGLPADEAVELRGDELAAVLDTRTTRLTCEAKPTDGRQEDA